MLPETARAGWSKSFSEGCYHSTLDFTAPPLLAPPPYALIPTTLSDSVLLMSPMTTAPGPLHRCSVPFRPFLCPGFLLNQLSPWPDLHYHPPLPIWALCSSCSRLSFSKEPTRTPGVWLTLKIPAFGKTTAIELLTFEASLGYGVSERRGAR